MGSVWGPRPAKMSCAFLFVTPSTPFRAPERVCATIPYILYQRSSCRELLSWIFLCSTTDDCCYDSFKSKCRLGATARSRRRQIGTHTLSTENMYTQPYGTIYCPEQYPSFAIDCCTTVYALHCSAPEGRRFKFVGY